MSILVAVPTSGEAQILRDLSGQIDVAAVQSDAGGVDRQTLRGQYNLSWARRVVPYVRLKAGIRYSRFDLDVARPDGEWREELQPSLDLAWRHPAFHFIADATRRETTARISSANVTRDALSLMFRTRSTTWPILTLRYDYSQTVDDVSPIRDTRDGRVTAEATHSTHGQSLTYRYRHDRLRNVITDLSTDEDLHHASWSGELPSPLENRLTITGGYRFEHRRRTDESTGLETILAPVPLAAGLYARDSSPELDELDELPGLVDGDLSSPTDPPIQIGGAFIDQNIGADLTVDTPVAAIYLFVDGLSGPDVLWDVYVSDDNLVWSPVSPPARSHFNLANERYEIDFGPVSARYVKAVNVTPNPELDVSVTEIRVLEASDSLERSRTISNTHLADTRVSFEIHSDLVASGTFTYQHVPTGGFRASRDDYTYTASARYQQSPALFHVARWDQEFQTTTGGLGDRSARSLSYTFDVSPVEALRGLASASARRTYALGSPEDEILTALARVQATPLTTISVTTEVTRSRTDQLDTGERFDTWAGRLTTLGTVTRWLTLELGTHIQDTETATIAARTRRTYHGRVDLRPTRVILLRGTVRTVDDRGWTTTQDYLLSWRPAGRLSLSSQLEFNRSRDGGTSDRVLGSMTYELGGRGSLYFTYTHLRQQGTINEATDTFQQGIRYAF